MKEVFEAELNHEDASNETDNIFVSNFAEKLQELNSDSSNISPDPIKRSQCIKEAVKPFGKFADLIYRRFESCKNVASTLEGIPPIISRVVPRVELSEVYKGKQFNSIIRFGPNRLEFIEFERNTILGGCPQFWTPFKGIPTCIAPTIIVAAPGKDLRLVHNLTFANKITKDY